MPCGCGAGTGNFPIRSQAIAESVGRAILERTAWGRVDLSNPAFTIFIEPHEEAIYLWTRRVKGPGGLPVGVAGRLVGMLSGGFDSPVAAWMMAGRGASLDFVHLTPSRPDPSSPTACKAAELVRVLSRYTGRSRLVLVPYTHFDLRLTGSRTGHEAVLFRRFAFRCGEAVARKFGAAALTTGDSLSQVASQTLENLISVDAALSLPVLRPLVGLDKVAIMDRAQRIGTWETSAVPAKDCCALIAGSPRTRSEPERIAELEGRLFPDPGEVVRLSLQEAVVGAFQGGEGDRGVCPGSRSVRALLRGRLRFAFALSASAPVAWSLLAPRSCEEGDMRNRSNSSRLGSRSAHRRPGRNRGVCGYGAGRGELAASFRAVLGLRVTGGVRWMPIWTSGSPMR